MDTCLPIDGSALMQAVDKVELLVIILIPFTRNVFNRCGSEYSTGDVLFDSYLETSIKAGAHSNRTGNVRSIRRVIDSRNVKLPESWKQLISLPVNKSELAAFLTHELIRRASELSPGNELVFLMVLLILSRCGLLVNRT